MGKYCIPGRVCVISKQCSILSYFASRKDSQGESDWMECAGGDATRSIGACTRLLDNPSQSNTIKVETYSKRALSYEKINDFDRAIADFGMAILLDPSGNLYRNRAFAFVKKGDFDGAIASLDEAISVNRRDGSSYAARGTIYQQRAATPKRHWTDLARAKAAYKMALRLTIETDGELELRKLALDNYTKISAEEGLSDYIASWLVDEPMYLLLAAISCILIASTIYGLFAFYSNPSRPTLVDQATVPSGRTPDLAAASTDGLLSDNLELSSVDYSTVMAPHDWIHHSPKHEDPKSEPKERKPTEKVSQRSPFDRGYRN
ncbi:MULTISPECIES: hypothetical protein [unclassified Bradyrhizobium]|uniref:tetratricopeptide repeat protein n=1 Tax=unclassified Bradyrhizobium TaxID=2631580 RepID=UPI003396F631